MTITILPNEKRCQQCGQAFDCGGLFGCWCWKVKLDGQARAALREQYSDCLCPDCLARAAGTSTDEPVSGKSVVG